MRIYRIRKFPAGLSLVILFVILVTFNSKIRSKVKYFAFEMLTGPFKAFSGGKTSFSRAKFLSDENVHLKERLGALSVALARMSETKHENERLKRLLDFKKNLPYTAIAARITARDTSDWRRAAIIDKGKEHGLKEGMPCATAKGFVGVVTEVGAASSKIMLINDPNSKIGVMLDGSRETGLLTGSPQGACRVIYLSVDGGAKVGDSVLTAGLSDSFPKGLTVGVVSAVGVEKTKLYRYAIVDPVEDISKLEEVVCIDTGGR